MKIAVLGTGTVGRALAQKLAALGHEIFIGTRNVENTLAKTEADAFGNPPIGVWLKENPEFQLVPFKEAAEKGSDMIVFAMNGLHAMDCLGAVGEELLNGKVMIDISNPLDFSNGFPPSLFLSNTDSLGEKIQRAYPTLKVVKTLNTMSNPVMVNPGSVPGEHNVFVSGNDESAKQLVKDLLQTFGWKSAQIIDLGDISTARGTEMILPLWLRLYGKLQTPFFNFSVNIAQ